VTQLRRKAWPIVVLFLLVAAACGQKDGVAGSVVAGPSDLAGGGTEFTDGTGTIDGGTTPTDTGTGATDGTTGSGGPKTGGGKPTTGTGGGTGGGTTGTGGGTGGGTTGGGAGGGAAAPSGPEDRTGITSSTIKIGIHAPETGAAAVSTFRQAVGVYSEYAGAIKGLGGRRIQVVARDDHFDPATARSVCKELVEKEKVFLLIGGAGVDQIKSCAEYAASVGVPYFSPGVTEGPFRSLQNYFALSETYNQQNVQIAQYIKSTVKKTDIGMVLTDSPLLDETEASFKAEAKRNGLNVVYSGRLAKDAGKTQTDTQISNLKQKGAEVVYALISPTVFTYLVSSAKQQAFAPVWVGPGLSIGVNLVAAATCSPPPFPDIRPMSPMVQIDVIDQYDAAYKPAYRKKNGSRNPDDIGILLWGLEKTVRLMMEAAGPNLSRQALVKTLTSGKTFASNVYAPVKYGAVPHFGANAVTLLSLNCNRLEFRTVKAFGTKF
jgi:ABC-type branched-subunit amino acid transport system substrate-binding protein